MKKTRPESKPVKTFALAPLNLTSDPSCSLEPPTVQQLAMLAATLARTTTYNPKALADAAMKLWYEAGTAIEIANQWDEVFSQECGTIPNELIARLESRPSVASAWFGFADEYPVTRDKFLKKALPKYKSRTADLGRIGKAFARDVLRQRNSKEPTLEEVSDAYGRWTPYPDQAKANAGLKRFKEWYETYIKEIRRAAGLKSAVKKKLKKKL